MKSQLHPDTRTPEQVWKDFVIACAKLDQHKAVTRNLRNLRCRVFVATTKERAK